MDSFLDENKTKWTRHWTQETGKIKMVNVERLEKIIYKMFQYIIEIDCHSIE